METIEIVEAIQELTRILESGFNYLFFAFVIRIIWNK